MRRLAREIKTIDDIQDFERVNARCSSKYVPIKSSAFVDSLQKHFAFAGGHQYRSGSSSHYIEMNKGNDISLYIENSFDRTLALRLSFKYNNFIFGRIKQVHRGSSAVEMIEAPDTISKWYSNAVQTIDTMRLVKLPQSDMQAIAEVAFKARGASASSIVDVNYQFNNALDFVLYLVNSIKAGDFYRKSPRSTRKLREVKSQSVMVKVNSAIWTYLEDNNPELYL